MFRPGVVRYRGGVRLLPLALLAGCAAAGDAAGPVDLLRRIDPARDAVRGEWRREDGALRTPPVRFAQLRIPYAPPEEYDLRMVVERVSGLNSVTLGLTAGGRRFALVVDAFDHDPYSGLDLMDGVAFPDNEAAHPGRILKNGEPTEVRCAVRRDRFRAWVGGEKIIDWKADWSRMSLYKDWTAPDAGPMFLGAWTAPFRIHALELTPVTGAGRPLR